MSGLTTVVSVLAAKPIGHRRGRANSEPGYGDHTGARVAEYVQESPYSSNGSIPEFTMAVPEVVLYVSRT